MSVNNSGVIAGVSAGAAIGVAMAAAERERAENERRRKSRMGNDQVLFETKKGIDEIGNEIADIYRNWYYKSEEGSIYRTSRGIFGWGSFVGGLVSMIAIEIFYFIFLVSMVCTDYRDRDLCIGTWYPIDAIFSAWLAIGVGILVGFVLHPVDTEVSYIRLTETKHGTRVLIKIYSSDGYRNIDDDELIKIEEMM